MLFVFVTGVSPVVADMGADMFSIGSNVIYGSNGVYKIEDIREESFCGEKRMYYVLSQLERKGHDKVFVPTDNEKLVSQMKKLLSEDEIYELVRSVPSEPMEWISDNRARSERFKEILARADRRELMHMTKTIYLRKEEMTAQGKKIFLSDENAMARAEKVIFDEFALVLDIEREEIIPFIMEQLQK